MRKTTPKPRAWLAVCLLSGTALVLAGQSQERATDEWLTRPVSDEVFESFLGFFSVDADLPLDVKVTETKERDGIREERLSFSSTPGERVPARLFWPAVGSSEQTSVVVIPVHGALGKDRQGLTRICEFLTRGGWGVLVFDLKHFGERSTGLMTTFTEPDKHENLYNAPSVYLEWITQSVKDVQRSVDFLIRERKADPERIALAGISRGAVVSLIAGAVETRFAAVVSILGGHFDALEREHLPAACPANYVGRIAPRPLFMLNAAHDADFDRKASVEPIFELAREPKAIHWADRGHSFTEEDLSVVLKWLQENVAK